MGLSFSTQNINCRGAFIFMAWVVGGKHFGQYTYEHWFDDEFEEVKKHEDLTADEMKVTEKNESTGDSSDSTIPHRPPQQP
jgi:hypothetical protein